MVIRTGKRLTMRGAILSDEVGDLNGVEGSTTMIALDGVEGSTTLVVLGGVEGSTTMAVLNGVEGMMTYGTCLALNVGDQG
jgi:hypothetical protein